jgi:glycosyltransferase involved in cell wall biosynthesis
MPQVATRLLDADKLGEGRPLLVLSDDWGRHPTSCQHLVRQLLPRHRVLWVNLIGMRRPGLDVLTLRRGWDKLRQWAGRAQPREALPPRLEVASPVLWPSFRRRSERWLNRRLLLRQLLPLLKRLPAAPVAITTQATMVALVGRLPVQHWVYYCVDDFAQWPGLDQATLRSMEAQLIARADRLIAAGHALRERLGASGRPVGLVSHGVDLALWRKQVEPLSDLVGLERPLVVFWGLVDRRLDAGFLQRLGAELARGTILLVGPHVDAASALARVPRLLRRPAVPYEQLPALASAADVLVMPYADLPVTRAMEPLKLKEYLAAGKPVVARDLPAVRKWRDCLDVAATAAEFSARVLARLAEGLPPAQAQARARLARESWAAKAALFEQLALQGPERQGRLLRRTPLQEGAPCASCA